MKNKKLMRIFSTVVFFGLLLLAVAKCADVLEKKEARKKYTPFFDSKTNFDVIFLGSSHMWNHVLPMEMWKEYGISSYNWGYSNCTPAENYYLLQDIVKYTSPKVVVIDGFGLIEYDGQNNGKYATDRIEQQHVQFDSFPIWSKNKIAASKDVFDDYDCNEDFIWNFVMYHNRWSELDQEDFEYEFTTEKGAYFLGGLGTSSYTPIYEEETIEIDSICYPYYLKQIEYCMEKGIQVLCIYIPFGSMGEDTLKIANSIGKIVEKYPNCTYVNMLNENILNFKTDICPDNWHLNYSGAAKITSWLGKYLSDNYTLDDYRNDAYWNNDYADYYEYKVSKIQEQTLLTSYLVQLADQDFCAELEVYDKKLLNSDRFLMLLDNAGIIPKYVEKNTDKCVRLIIRSALTGDIIDDEYFMYESKDNDDVFLIKKVAE